MRVAVLALFGLGCGFDLSVLERPDGGSTDASVADAASSSARDGAADVLAVEELPGCPRPWVMIARHHSDGTSIVRFSLRDNAPPARCADLTGAGALDPGISSPVALPNNRVFVAGPSRVQVVDARSDRVLFDQAAPIPLGQEAPVWTAPLEAPNGEPLVVARWVGAVRAFDHFAAERFDFGPHIGPETNLAFAPDPVERTRLLAIADDGVTLLSVDPFESVALDRFSVSTYRPTSLGAVAGRLALVNTIDLYHSPWPLADDVSYVDIDGCGIFTGATPDPTRADHLFVHCTGDGADVLAHVRDSDSGWSPFEVLAGSGRDGSFAGLSAMQSGN